MHILLTYRDDSALHSEQVKTYTKMLIMHFNRMYPERAISKDLFEAILVGAEMHDIGKLAVPEEGIFKKENPTPEEVIKIQNHTVLGAEIIDRMENILKLDKDREVMHNICKYHHERYDGSGFPFGMVGDSVPIYAQIVALAELYSDLVEQCGTDSTKHNAVIADIASGKYGAFNPILIECLYHATTELLDAVCVRDSSKRLNILQNLNILNKSNYWKRKRLFDIFFAGSILLIFSPLYLLIMLIIVLDDPKGGPFYAQTRLG